MGFFTQNKKGNPFLERDFELIMDVFRIALGEFDVKPNLPEQNFLEMKKYIEKAKQNGVNLIIFPEMCISGYMIGDKYLEDDFCRNMMEYNDKLLKESEGIAIVYGNIFLDENINERTESSAFHPNKDGRIRRYNAIYAIQNQRPLARTKPTPLLPKGVHLKTLLPNYRVFDDQRYFFSLLDTALDFNLPLADLCIPFLLELNGTHLPIGVEACEDLWVADYRLDQKPLNPSQMLIENGAELLINISSSPWTFGKNQARDRKVQYLYEQSDGNFVPFLYCNHVGCQNNGKNFLTFDGGSTVYNAEGKPLLFSQQPFKPELMIFSSSIFSQAKPLVRKELSKIHQKYLAIQTGIKHISHLLGKTPNWVIGLSGGIDSALVCALLVHSVGKDHVYTVNLPTKYNSKKTKNAAKRIAENLDVPYLEIPISPLVKQNIDILEQITYQGKDFQLTTLDRENIQAKIRGTSILSNLSAKVNGVFSNNGNKVEIGLGYATLYGDVGGALAPIGDLTKEEVFEMAELINRMEEKPVIPDLLFPDELFRFDSNKIVPSAELKEDQIDPMKFGYHCRLLEKIMDYKKTSPEEILQWYLNGQIEEKLQISTELIKRWELDNPQHFLEDLEWFLRSMQINVFKRIQAPPIIVTSKTAYGYDLRESQLQFHFSSRYHALKTQILQLESRYPFSSKF